MKVKPRLQVLLEMRPAFDGYAGIPQETRLLFRGLCMTDSLEVEGLLQTSHRFLAAGTKNLREQETEASVAAVRFHRYSRVIISIETKPSTQFLDEVIRYLKKQRITYALTLSALLLPKSHKIETSRFGSRYFEDFIWRTLFAKTLPAADFSLVTARNHRVCSVPWNIMQTAGLNSLKFVTKPVYPILNTLGVDIFIAQTPYPARVDEKTVLVVRYHDAFPVFMPHTVANKSRHEATHYYALMSNVQSGAYFACVSEATRQDLLRLFPEVQDRAITIHNMVAHHFYEEDSSADCIPQIVRSRLNQLSSESSPEFISLDAQEQFYTRHLSIPSFNYLLIVSTIEPRKNHSRLIAAWEIIRAESDPAIKLVIVGSLGWDCEPIMREMRAWIDQGELFVLSNVPADDLRLLYHHAAATVCPSLAEGFDFSGVESMRCGGVVIASDIPVHREIYADAAEYFDPYCTASLVHAIKKTVYDQETLKTQEKLRVNGKKVSACYLPEIILPQWEKFLNRVALEKNAKDQNAELQIK